MAAASILVRYQFFKTPLDKATLIAWVYDHSSKFKYLANFTRSPIASFENHA